MKVSTQQPFSLVYALFEHQYLGPLLESFVVQVNPRGDLTYTYQNISHKNMEEFGHGLTEDDRKLIRWMDDMQQEAVLKKFNPRKLKPIDFFLKVWEKDKQVQEVVNAYMENLRSLIFPKLMQKRLFLMGKDGNPIWRQVQMAQEPAKVYFHFDRQAEQTYYFPNILYQGNRVKLQTPGARILSDQPAFLLIDQMLYYFEPHTDGKKLRPFLDKFHIQIPKKLEDTYYQKFIAPLVGQFKVFAKGFAIESRELPISPILTLAPATEGSTEPIWEDTSSATKQNQEYLYIELTFAYGGQKFPVDNFATHAHVEVHKEGDSWTFRKIKRKISEEKYWIKLLTQWGLPLKTGKVKWPRSQVLAWCQDHQKQLQEVGITVQQPLSGRSYFLGYAQIRVTIDESEDWFDIRTHVQFGEFTIPFLEIRQWMLEGRREFPLPNGEIAVIPEEWFAHYIELWSLSEVIDAEAHLAKHHLALVEDLSHQGWVEAHLSQKLQALQQFQSIAEEPLPQGFEGTLRPYQKAGYDWMHFLYQYRLGGCLADDMGLGKTVMTLAFLQSIHEKPEHIHPSLIVLPTSLIYNWQKEAERFTPKLKIYIHSGTYRSKEASIFEKHDLILMSYSVLRIDIDFIKKFHFTYVILDESQAIKNPGSNISQAVRELQSENRLILTGTPLENSTMDLWSQMSFVNPGLLGSQSFFKTTYQLPIEKHQDDGATKRLFRKIKPFMLRRHKSQVATELPEKIQTIHYSDMAEEQWKRYEETKSYYRNLILEQIEKQGIQRSQMMVLEGLTKLRQIANDPVLVDPEFTEVSGKRRDVLHKLESTLKNNHKVLIFSQFVKHLQVYKAHFDTEGIPYCYLDGATQNRQEVVERFQTDPQIQVFLISLKAGGVGLNLTAAEYVFILDPWWNPAIEAQAIDRAHRIGQLNKVFTYKFITRNSVEEKILVLQQNKKRLFDELITTEESFFKNLSTQDMLALLD